MKRLDGRPRSDKGSRKEGYHQAKTLVDVEDQDLAAQVARFNRRRKCARCGCTLNSYNAGRYCWPCMAGTSPIGSA